MAQYMAKRSAGHIVDGVKLNCFFLVHVFHITYRCILGSSTKIQVIMDTKVSLIKENCGNYPNQM